ncbi:proline--tRNA ligase [Chengkuizengella axinellae]|uniref:Proline--tRNA ligase n=1 Tax=Chengkuizengella axinellae TaxID=3064388 RepID=A0ABT9J6C5_9BACL|nr:proline--tRNA ligase [Chengkuizengella sp. 2205SS18-9]MDP5277178.1 proline--tRNA ligase [Chengkuizengella sp. 2205SS18-9]
MRQSSMFIPTLREVPSEAEAKNHQLLLRSGFIRQTAAGIYTYLPLGWRVLRKIENIIREEMEITGANELHMPAMQPIELLKSSGRDALYGDELMKLNDRHEREFALGPTHEEVITSLIKSEVNSYRQLPLNLYQIQTKFRDERRPRFGLLRGREFIMKDAYSFNTDWEGLDQTYWAMFDAYHRIFKRLDLNYRSVEAESGAIGDEGGTHEFMALADIGEDTIVTCTSCDYSANDEKAEYKIIDEIPTSDHDSFVNTVEKLYTPNLKSIENLTQDLNINSEDLIKTLIYFADGKLIAVLVRGDREVNEHKMIHFLDVEQIELADTKTVEKATGVIPGFVGPVKLDVPIYVDYEVERMTSGICGANELNYHLKNVIPGRDFSIENTGDFRMVSQNDQCPNCGENFKFNKGIEIGHVFKLGTRYSKKLDATFLDSKGKEQEIIMGCYGIGVSRLLSAIIEQNNDHQGIIWPKSTAPFRVHIIVINKKDITQMNTANDLYQKLSDIGIEVLLDDRDERPGVKFKDADLIGIPYRITIGKKIKENIVEMKVRQSGEQHLIEVDESLNNIIEFIKN